MISSFLRTRPIDNAIQNAIILVQCKSPVPPVCIKWNEGKIEIALTTDIPKIIEI